jgi:oligopeptide/dipeptide ABC transporter ATP-binding protein
MDSELLSIKDLSTYFFTEDGIVKAVDSVTLSLKEGDTLGLVGESGCGKSVTALSIMRLVPHPPGKIVAGEIRFLDKNLLALTESEMRKIRGNKISMIFQEPATSLNPSFRVGDQIGEAIRLHQGLSRKQALAKSIEMLNLVGIPSANIRVRDYPHKMSGGMRQRVMIAMALSCNPKLMIADEPTTALDVTIQAQILDLMNKLKEQIRTSIILITHDLGVIAENAQFVAVMYAGKVVEYADVETLFDNPNHPYTIGLMSSMPNTELAKAHRRLNAIPGTVPSLFALPSGCKFNDRCPKAFALCRQEEPSLKEIGPAHQVRCWLY